MGDEGSGLMSDEWHQQIRTIFTRSRAPKRNPQRMNCSNFAFRSEGRRGELSRPDLRKGEIDQFDIQPLFLNENGTLDLRTGGVTRPPDDSRSLSNQLHEKAKCQMAEFLDRVFGRIRFNQVTSRRQLGYTLTGAHPSTPVCLLRSRQEWQAVFLTTTQRLLGQYAANMGIWSR